MVRQFDPDGPVPREAVERCLDAALRAPSAGYSQGWTFVVLRDPAQRERFWQLSTPPERMAHPDAWLRGVSAAPVLILCCSDPGAYLDRYAEPDKGWTDRSLDRWPVPYWDVDTGMAALLILLAAVDQSLGALFFGVPADRHTAVLEGFDLPPGRRLVGVVALGQEARAGPRLRGSAHRRPRRSREEVTHWERFGASGEETSRGG
jgi:nitroreductase